MYPSANSILRPRVQIPNTISMLYTYPTSAFPGNLPSASFTRRNINVTANISVTTYFIVAYVPIVCTLIMFKSRVL